MSGFVVDGYAMVSADGMLADESGVMPEKLMIDADQRFFEAALDRSDLVVHGRKSQEHLHNSAARKRLVVTKRIAAIESDPELPSVRYWNPAGASLEQAAEALGVTSGRIGIIGGTEIFQMFLDRYDTFWLSQTLKFSLPHGVPVFREVPAKTPQAVLAAHGYRAQEPVVNDPAEKLTIVPWRKNERQCS